MSRKTIDELLERPYWIVDILPRQVPSGSHGQYFRIEDYWLSDEQFPRIKQKHIDIILKLNCYRDISLYEEEELNPSPEHIAADMSSRYVCIMTGDSMIVSDTDCTYLTVFDPDYELLELIRELASAEGMFVWKPEQ